MLQFYASQIPNATLHLQRRSLEFGSGWMQFRTAEEPDSLRGAPLDFVVVDEAAHLPNLREIWELSLRSTLIDRQGEAWFISTPNGWNYFSELFKRGERGEPGWGAFRYSSRENPHLVLSELDELAKDMPALVRRQEIEAEFVQLAGAMFNRDWVRYLDAEPANVRWVRSWDLAFTLKTSSDRTAGAKVGFMRDGTVVVAHVVAGKWEWPQAVAVVSETARQDGAGVRVGVESVGAQVGFLHQLQTDPKLIGIAMEPVKRIKDKLTMALPLFARAEQGKLAFVRGAWNQECMDELCLTHNCKVFTLHGEKEICLVSVGERVLTRSGYQTVLKSEATRARSTCEITLRSGRKLRCSLDHPVWVVGRGFIRADSIRAGDVTLRITKEKHITVLRKAKVRQAVITSDRQQSGCCTVFCGNTIMERFLKATTCTTLTGIHSTTELTISPAYLRLNTLRSIKRLRCIGRDWSPVRFVKGLSFPDRQERKRVLKNAGTFCNGSEATSPNINALASAAANRSRHCTVRQDSVGTPVLAWLQQGAGRLLHVRYAIRDSFRNGPVKSVVPDVVESIKVTGCVEPLWNLQVACAHEFFADGILVHNCAFDGSGKGHDDQVDAITGALTLLSEPSGAFGSDSGIMLPEANEVDRYVETTRVEFGEEMVM